MQSRFRSPVVWASLVPVVLLLGDTYGLWDIIGMPKTSFIQLISSVSAVLVAFGILNSPTNKSGF